MRLTELGAKDTLRAIVGRRIYRVRCQHCNRMMVQEEVESLLPDHPHPSRSMITLRCKGCGARIELELTLSNPSRQSMLESLGLV